MTRNTQLTSGPSHDCIDVRRRALLGWGAAACFAPGMARAQEFPSRTIRIMVGVPPGGSIDFAARLIAPAMSEILRTPVIVESKPGAAGVINTDYVAKSPADGYTLLLGTPSSIIIAPQAMPRFTFNPLVDLTAINMVSTSPIAIAVNPKLPVHRLKDLVELSKKRPVTLGLPTAGSVSHLTVELAAKATGANIQMVPYKGGGPALNDTMGGHVDATVGDVGSFLPLHREGRVRIVMVSSEKRNEAYPDVPTADEDAPGLVVTNWIGVFAPGKTPKAIIDKLNDALVKAAAKADVKAQFLKASATSASMPGPESFQKFVASEYVRYGRILRERGIVLQE